MKFIAARLPGLCLIKSEPIRDKRGLFARSFCRREFEEHGIDPNVAQCNISFNERRGTLRGMHIQVHPHGEAKLVRCTRGAIFDVALDLRRDSPTFLQWEGFELAAESRAALFIPKGFAHGFQTLEDASEVFYQMSEFYHPECARGVRWNDAVFGIEWPLEDGIVSERDASYPDFQADVLA